MKWVILTGGRGSRLWPLSQETCPKQFLSLTGDLSLLQQTIERLLSFCEPQDLILVTCNAYESLVQRQCQQLGIEEEVSILVEPSSRGTAPAFALALLFLQEEQRLHPEEVVVLVPADGLISPVSGFIEAMYSGKKSAKQGSLVVFGVPPTRAETGYGYIELGEKKEGVFAVKRFLEKPSKELAENLFLEPSVLWNTGYLQVVPRVFWEEMQFYQPEIALFGTLSLSEGKQMFSSLQNSSLDHALLEKSKNVVVCPMDVAWSDIGSWDSLYELYPKDVAGNVKKGAIDERDSKNCFFFADKRPIVAIGLEDLLVVDTAEGLFLGKRGESQRIKEFVLPSISKEVKRPWGSYTVLEEGDRYKVKKIIVLPNCRLSLQMHHHRSEHWFVVQGEAFVEIGDLSRSVYEQDSVFIPILTCHRLSNKTKEILEIIEVQSGEILTEEDIVRFEDDYARDVVCSNAH